MESSNPAFISIFNDVLGPVMRGQSSSHTAGSYYIGKLIRELFGETPSEAVFTFDPDGSYGRVFRAQGSDLGFAAGLMGWPITDERYNKALEIAIEENILIQFLVSPIPEADHPNSVKILLKSKAGKELTIMAKSTGGGSVRIVRLNDWNVNLNGKNHVLLVSCEESALPEIQSQLKLHASNSEIQKRGHSILLVATLNTRPDAVMLSNLTPLSLNDGLFICSPFAYPKRGEPIFSSAKEIHQIAKEKNISLGEIALGYEAALLGLSKNDCLEEMKIRLRVMLDAIQFGFDDQNVNMQLLEPSAHKIDSAIKGHSVAMGGPHSEAAAKAMAVMHTANSMGIVCAAPTGGSAGVIPGVLSTLIKEKNLDETQSAYALFAAGAVGLILAIRGTFAAEIAGCQVEIGAAGAMGAAAVIDAIGGRADLALNAAAISFQNTMGSACDLVQGICEIPCHTRNAVAASSAFICADIILGGYQNSVPLDETIDAVISSGKMLPAELRCTSLGGLAVAPSAVQLKRNR
ncbi:MAG: L-serine ammonia-lyase, iron-sulfur-dependent, subunit alpha [Candidatus Aminicenantes bacterium]|nr:L-serine ammonia-lyase, iron-sulfur-dependent, subunit alpha [Candidatus Aminicenantes bacterium]